MCRTFFKPLGSPNNSVEMDERSTFGVFKYITEVDLA